MGNFNYGSGTPMSAGTGAGANLLISKWERTIEPALYDKMEFVSRTSETVEQIMNQLTVRRLGRIAMQTLGASSDGTDFAFSDLTPTTVTLTPYWAIVAVAYPDSLPRRAGDEVDPAFKDNTEAALAAGIDNLELQAIPSATYFIGNNGYGIDAAGLRFALTQLATNTRRNVQPGDEIYLLLDTGQIANALAIPEINRAMDRGDGKSPQVTGVMTTGYGYKFNFTTLLAQDGNGRHGLAWVPSMFKHGYNKRPGVEKQRFMKQTRIMADAEIAGNIVFPEKLVAVRTA